MDMDKENKNPNQNWVKIIANEQQKNIKHCCVCDAPTTMDCSSCHLVSYCSIEHQKMDWKNHKKVCASFRVEDVPESENGSGSCYRKCCIATRDLKANTIVLEESPILQVPEYVGMGIFKPHCLTCGVDMRNAGPSIAQYRCSVCSWPVCSFACSKSPIHAENECRYFVENKLSFGAQFNKCDNVITNIRATNLKERKPVLWKKLLKLQMPERPDIDEINDEFCSIEPGLDSSYSIRIEHLPNGMSISRIDNSDRGNQTGSSTKTKRKKADIGPPCPYDELPDLVTCQGFRLQGGRINEGSPGRSATYLYSAASNFSHECSPNCHWSIGGSPNFKIRIRTCVPIAKGEKLTVSRIINLEDAIKGTRIRQHCFKSIMKMYCKCKLCSDPTEFATFMSAVTCTSCLEECDKKGVKDAMQFGYLIPLDPLAEVRKRKGQASANDSGCLWGCVKCGKTVASSSLDHDRWIEIGRELSGLNTTFSIESGRSLSFCEEVINKFSGRQLHPNHWLFQCAYRLLCLCYVNRLQREYNDSRYQDCLTAIQVGRYLMPLYDKLFPGYNPFRVYLLRAMINANYAVCYPRMLTLDTVTEKTAKWMYQGFQDCLVKQTEAYDFYRAEPSFPHEENPRICDRLLVGCHKIRKHLANLEARLATFKLQNMNLCPTQKKEKENGNKEDRESSCMTSPKAKKARKSVRE